MISACALQSVPDERTDYPSKLSRVNCSLLLLHRVLDYYYCGCQVLDAIELMIRIKQQMDQQREKKKTTKYIAGWETIDRVTVD